MTKKKTMKKEYYGKLLMEIKNLRKKKRENLQRNEKAVIAGRQVYFDDSGRKGKNDEESVKVVE